MTETTILIGMLGAALLLALIALVVAIRRDHSAALDARLAELGQGNERLERELRAAVEGTSAQVRVETSARLAEVQAGLTQQMWASALASTRHGKPSHVSHRMHLLWRRSCSFNMIPRGV